MSKKNKRKNNTREPLEYDPPFESEEQPEQPRTKYKTVMVYVLDQDEVNSLIEASNSVYVEPPGPLVNTEYSTYTEEECVALVDGNFHPRKSRKKK